MTLAIPKWLEPLLAFQPLRDIPYATFRGVVLYTGLIVVFIVLERILRRGDAIRYRQKSVFNDYVYCIFYNGGYFTLLVYPLLKLSEHLLAPYRVDFLPKMSLWVAVPVFYLLMDFAFYWTHRLLHTKYLWPFHSVHHAQQELTVLTTARFHLVDVILLTLLTGIPGVLLGFPAAVGIVTWMQLVQDKVQHANLGWTYGPFYKVIVSPRFHRIHHGAGSDVYGTNYGRVFPIWDYLFGTAHASQEEPARFGVDGNEVPESLRAQFVMPFRQVWRMIRKPSPSPEAPVVPAST
jgi:sterol desaturase/sphingolipid hydroxylase (fatty acid hydroxylase superfamily)